MKHQKSACAVALVAAASLVSACGVGPDKSREDAHDTTNVDKAAPKVVAFNNKFPNVELKCDGYGHRVFVTSTKKVIILPDPTCAGFVRGAEPTVLLNGSGE